VRQLQGVQHGRRQVRRGRPHDLLLFDDEPADEDEQWAAAMYDDWEGPRKSHEERALQTMPIVAPMRVRAVKSTRARRTTCEGSSPGVSKCSVRTVTEVTRLSSSRTQ
jgi:hypothetical protein